MGYGNKYFGLIAIIEKHKKLALPPENRAKGLISKEVAVAANLHKTRK